jgi:hypothetical protein
MKNSKNETITWGSVLREFPEEAQLIAQIISEWNVVEFEFVNLLSTMLRAPAPIISPMVFAIANNRGRLDVMEAALVRLADGEELPKLVALLKEARAVLDRRNSYTHAVYVSSTTPRRKQLQAMSFKALHANKPDRIAIHRKELAKDVARTTALIDELRFGWLNKVFAPTPPQESPEAAQPILLVSERDEIRTPPKRRKPPRPSSP